jgi:hypothetical protein
MPKSNSTYLLGTKNCSTCRGSVAVKSATGMSCKRLDIPVYPKSGCFMWEPKEVKLNQSEGTLTECRAMAPKTRLEPV